MDKAAELAQMGIDPGSVEQVSLDLKRMLDRGILVDIDIHGMSIFTTRTSWEELGIRPTDLRSSRFRRGTKDVIPGQYIKRLRSLETQFRQCLERHSFEIQGFRPWRYVPFTAYESFRRDWDKLKDALDDLKATIIANRDLFVDELAADFASMAREAWAAITARRPADAGPFVLVVPGNGVFESSDNFVDYVVSRAVGQVPSAEAIQSCIWVDYRNAMLVTGVEEAQAHAEIAQAREAARLASIQANAQARMALAEADEAEKLSRLRIKAEESRLYAMRQAELEHARQQLAGAVSPIQDVLDQLRAQIYRDVQEIAESIERNGHLRGRVAERARGLLDTVQLLNAHGDADLEVALDDLRSRMDVQPDDGTRYSIDAVMAGLNKVADLTHQSALDIAARAQMLTRSGAIEL